MNIGICWDLARRKEVEAVVGQEIEWCSSVEDARLLLRVHGPRNLLMPEELFLTREGYDLYLALPRTCRVYFWHMDTKEGFAKLVATQYTRAFPLHIPEWARNIHRPWASKTHMPQVEPTRMVAAYA